MHTNRKKKQCHDNQLDNKEARKKDHDLKSLLQKEAENNNTRTVNKSIDYS